MPAGSSSSSLGGHSLGGGTGLGVGAGKELCAEEPDPAVRGVSISADTAQGLSLEWHLSPGMSGPRQVTSHRTPFPHWGAYLAG